VFWIEIAALLLGLVYVLLAIYESRWCWLFGGLSSLLYVIIFLPQKLLVFSGLNVFYIILAVVGFFRWNAAKREDLNVIRRMGIVQLASLIILGVIFSVILYLLLKNFYKSDVAAFEAVAGGAAIVATMGTIAKFLENWLFWIFSNMTYIILFLLNRNFPTAALYFVFSLFALFGYFRWRQGYYARVQ